MNRMRYVKIAAGLLLIAALVVVVAQNRAPVQTHFLLITVEMPQILLLALTAAAGFALGLLAPALMRRSHRVWPRPDGASRSAAPAGADPAADERTA